MSKDSTQRPRPESNRGPFDPKSDAATDILSFESNYGRGLSGPVEKLLCRCMCRWYLLYAKSYGGLRRTTDRCPKFDSIDNTSSQPGLLTVGYLFPSPIGNLDPVDRTIEAARVKVHHRPYSLRMVRWCIRLMRLTLVCEVIRYRLVQVRPTKSQKKTFRVGGPQSPFSISSSFILFFILFPFFLNTKMKTSCEPQVNGFFDHRPR